MDVHRKRESCLKSFISERQVNTTLGGADGKTL